MSKGKLFFCCLVLAPGVALAAPNGGVCDGLQSATAGLYGLCLAFCEAQNCAPDITQPDPFAGCTPSSERILELYNQLKTPNDPDMPCVEQESVCPCFSASDLEAIPTPYVQCLIDYDPGSEGGPLVTNVFNAVDPDLTGAQVSVSEERSFCVYCDPNVVPTTCVAPALDYATGLACQQMLEDFIRANQDQCLRLCDPTCH